MADEHIPVWKQQVEARASEAGTRVRGIASAIQTLADDMRAEPGTALIADYTERGAGAIERFGVYLEESEFETLIADAEELGREHPLAMAAAGLALGVAVSRVVKATAARRSVHASPRARPATTSKAAKPRRPRTKKAPVER